MTAVKRLFRKLLGRDLGKRVGAVALQAWTEAGLPVAPGAKLVRNLVIVRLSAAEYAKVAPPRSVAFLGWRDQGATPVAYVSPLATDQLVAHAALHEAMHALVYRSGLHADYNASHKDGRVWAGFAWSLPGNAEARGQKLLDAV